MDDFIEVVHLGGKCILHWWKEVISDGRNFRNSDFCILGFFFNRCLFHKILSSPNPLCCP